MTIDRKTYFDTIRGPQFAGKLSQQQVDGQDAILAEWESTRDDYDLRWLAYALATSYHETAATMWPIEEYGKGAGRPYGVPDPVTGKTYYGRGLVQLTWKDNYQKMGDILDIDLVNKPETALDPVYAGAILFEGMERGTFTGRKLADYFNDTRDDPVNARQIVNGNDKDTLIAGYHTNFLAAVKKSYVAPLDVKPDRKTETITIKITVPKGTPVEVTRGSA